MNLINKKIQHRQYGIGIIIEQADTQITVQFDEPYGMKKFLYPMAFESYLTLCDLSLQKEVMALVQIMHEKEAAEKKQRKDAMERLRQEKLLALLEQKRVSAKKRSQATKRTAPKTKATQSPHTKSASKADDGVSK